MLIKHIKLLCTYYILIEPTFSTRNIGDVFCKETGQNKLKNCFFIVNRTKMDRQITI